MKKAKIINNFLRKCIVIDSESTGLDSRTAEIAELGSTHLDNNDKIIIQNELFGTIEPMPFMASNKNNISREMLKGLPIIKDSDVKVIRILKLGNDNYPYMVAHNAKYDKTILTSTFERNENDELANELAKKNWICTYRLAKHLFKPSPDNLDFNYQLNYLRYAFDLDCGNLGVHRAGDDSMVCFQLLKYIANYVLDNVIDLNDISEDFDLGEFLVSYSESPIEINVMPFGKHFAQKLEDVPLSYYNWLLKNHGGLNADSDEYDPDFSIAIEKELNRRLDNQE